MPKPPNPRQDAAEHIAAGKIFEFKAMLDEGKIELNGRYGHVTWVHQTVQHKSMPILDLLITRGADVNLPDDNGLGAQDSPLMTAATMTGGRDFVVVLIANGANVNYKNADGRTVLHQAAYEGLINMVKYLAPRTDPNAKDKQGYTAFLNAVAGGKASKVGPTLLKYGADPTLATNIKRTALHHTALRPKSKGLSDEVQYLLSIPAVKAQVNAKDDRGGTALLVAAIRGSDEVLKPLIENGADVNLADNNGQTPLHFAAYYLQFSTAKQLVEKGADRTRKNSEGKMPVDMLPAGTPQSYYDLLAPPAAPEAPSPPYKGYTKSDAELFNQMFEEPNEWSCCPVCLAYVRRSDGCMYMKHECKREERHEKLFEIYKDTRYKASGEMEWCTICGRATYGHKHFMLSRASDRTKPAFAPVSAEAPEGHLRHFDSDCKRVGGGGFEEKVRRTHRLLGYACELQAEVGKIPEREARNELIEEVWNAGDMRNRKVAAMIEGKKFEFPCTFPEDEKPAAAPEEEKVYPDIPRPDDQKELTPVKHEAPDNDCVVEMGPHDDGRPSFEFRHKQADGTVVNHALICGEDLEMLVRAQTMDGLCRIEPDKCKAKLYPEELKDIVTPEFYEIYRQRFNQANAAQGGGAGGLMRPLEMDTATCAPPQKAARRRTRRAKKVKKTRRH